MIDNESGWIEADIEINGYKLTFAESMTLRVAIGSFRISLTQEMKKNLGKELGDNYDKLASNIENYIMSGINK